MQGTQNDPNYVRRLKPKKIFFWFVRLLLAIISALFIAPYVAMFFRAGRYLSFAETPIDMWLNLSVFPLWYLAHWKQWSWPLAGLMATVFGAKTAVLLLYFYQLHTVSLIIVPIAILGILAIARLPTRMDWMVTFSILFWAHWCGLWDMSFDTEDAYLEPWDSVEISISEGYLRLRPHGVIPYDYPFQSFGGLIDLSQCNLSRRYPERSDNLTGECTVAGFNVELWIPKKSIVITYDQLPRFQQIVYGDCHKNECLSHSSNSIGCYSKQDLRYIPLNEIEFTCDTGW
jgi:hypothetical protein